MRQQCTIERKPNRPCLLWTFRIFNYSKLMKNYLVVLLLGILFFPGILAAQTEKAQIRGLVENETGEALESVTVELSADNDRTKRTAVTDAAGIFQLDVQDVAGPYKLTISYVGYITQIINRERVNQNKEESLYIILKPSATSLDNVVFVGYGFQKRSAVTGAVSELPIDGATDRSVNSIQELFQGKSPGLVVTNEGGDPTSVPRVNIRGLGGINGEQPLYVVDGAISSGAPVINPGDIESVTILKDAAAAIYGARASGGVIVITTRKGRSSEPIINLDAKYGSQQVWRKLEALNAKEYADVYNLAADNAGRPRLDVFNAAINPDGQITRTNWIDEVFTTGKINEYSASVDGRNDKSNYYLSFGYRRAEGILHNTYNERYNFMVNTEHQLRSWLKIGEKMNYRITEGRGANTSDVFEGTLLSAIWYPPSISPYTETGAFSGLPLEYAGGYGAVLNPVAYLKRLDNAGPSSNLFVNTYLEADILKQLSFRTSLTINKSNTLSKSFRSRVLEIGKIFDFNQLNMGANNASSLLTEHTLTYDNTFNNHHFNILGGYTYQYNTQEGFSVVARDFDDERPEYRYFANANPPFFQPSGSKIESALISYLGRINYEYNSKYLLSLIARRDGSSLVAPQNRFQNYGSISGGWIVSRENFFSGVDWLTQLKIRSSYGVLGNLGSLPVGSINVPLVATAAYLGLTPTLVPGYAERAISNPDLTWARSEQFNLGADISVFNNRLSFTFDYFVKNISDMILTKQPASTTGVSDPTWINGGTAQDKGIELAVNYSSNSNSAFQYSIGAVLTKLSNKLLSLNDGVTNIPTTGYNVTSALTPLLIQVGVPLYSYHVVKTDGIFKSQQEVNAYVNKNNELIQPNAQPGDFRFVDANDDGKIDNNDRVVVGSPYPSFSYGFSFNASYKNFDLNVLLQGVHDNILFNGFKYMTLQPSPTGQNFNLLKDMLNAWSPENINSNIPRASQTDANNNYGTTSDWYVEDGSYLRVRNLTIGYTLPERLVRKAGLNNLRVYGTANNLFTFTKYSGFDPEVGMNELGIDRGLYPQARSVFAGLSLIF